MAQERIAGEPRELNFYGEGKALDIHDGFAITSLRNPRTDYAFEKGEIILANCQDDGEKIPVIVISNETKQIREFSVPQLLMDGFVSIQETVEGMKPYPGYENTDEDTEFQAITFVKAESFEALSNELKIKILSPENKFDDLIAVPELRHLFLPTMCRHMINKGATAYDWGDFLYFNGLVSWQELTESRSATFRAINYYNFVIDHEGAFEKLFAHPGSPGFKVLVSFQAGREIIE